MAAAEVSTASAMLLPAPSHAAILKMIKEQGLPYLGGKTLGVAFSNREAVKAMMAELRLQGLVVNTNKGRGQPVYGLTAEGYKEAAK